LACNPFLIEERARLQCTLFVGSPWTGSDPPLGCLFAVRARSPSTSSRGHCSGSYRWWFFFSSFNFGVLHLPTTSPFPILRISLRPDKQGSFSVAFSVFFPFCACRPEEFHLVGLSFLFPAPLGSSHDDPGVVLFDEVLWPFFSLTLQLARFFFPLLSLLSLVFSPR